MADEPLTLALLTKFHREMIAPEFARIAGRFGRIDGRLHDLLGHFEAIHKRFDRLEQIRVIEERLPGRRSSR